MPSTVEIYKMKDFIRQNESGVLSEQRVSAIINRIASVATLHPDHNILLDFRETRIADVSMVDILKAAITIEKFKDVLKNKIANVIPDDSDRIDIAKRSEAAIQLKGINYRFFTEFEDAIDWFAGIA